ncbi:alpha-E domain-containing protein [Methylobacillus flagellatus]|uniref:alpha-E domain-containing protein n=1 Tax=Methylobacillus flagellatus TaxID=405 RepID=UPI0010F7B28D|nr:alpha-E domain-containing protein [Methylobacillus flagellatus]
MLSRTADHLYWMARYIERAENMARVLDVTDNMSLVPNAAASEAALWGPALEIAGAVTTYEDLHDTITANEVIHFLALDPRNPSSIYSALLSARENARAVRAAISSETWENINSLWLEFAQFQDMRLLEGHLHEFCDWVKSRSHLFRGVSFGTMLHDDAFRFLRLGTFIERADNTARLLDVKYHLLLPNDEEIGGAVDYYEWSAVLRSVSAFQAYQKVFSDSIEPWRVAELLVLRQDMPRSLHACLGEITAILDQLPGRRNSECLRVAGELHARLRYGRMEEIFQGGLHEFLEDFVVGNNNLGLEIQRSFLNAQAA